MCCLSVYLTKAESVSSFRTIEQRRGQASIVTRAHWSWGWDTAKRLTDHRVLRSKDRNLNTKNLIGNVLLKSEASG